MGADLVQDQREVERQVVRLAEVKVVRPRGEDGIANLAPQARVGIDQVRPQRADALGEDARVGSTAPEE